jgi:hypothetical protein
LLCSWSCEGTPTQESPAAPTGPAPETTEVEANSPPTPPDPKCEEARPRFEDLDWLADSRFALLLERHDQDLDATLAALADGSLRAAPPLPVFARFELQNLGLERRTLSLVLDGLGVDPAQVLKVHGPKNESVWFIPLPCDYSTIEASATRRWQVGFRGEVSVRIGVAPADSALPFDLLLLPGARAALVPRGRSGALVRWMNGAGVSSGAAALMGSGSTDSIAPGLDLQSVEAAPIRLRLAGRALGARPAGEDARMVERFRITPEVLQRAGGGDSVPP